MKNKLQSAYKPTPEPFRDSVRSSVHEATAQTIPQKRCLSGAWRVVIAAVILIALIPCAIFGASKLYSLIAKPVGNYGLEMGIERETSAAYPLYVKMQVELPEGFSEVPDTEGLKYHKTDSESQDSGFALQPMRSDSDETSYIANVSGYEERVIGGHPAYDVTVTNVKGDFKQLYVYFEDVNVMLLIYYKDVTDDLLTAFVSGIHFTEGTAGDHTELFTPYDERQDSEITYRYDETFIEIPTDTALTFKGYSPITDKETLRYTARITDIRITDSIRGLDENNFNPAFIPSEIADENGVLTAREFRTFSEGDGFTDTYEELSREQKPQKLVIAEITYENLCDEDVELYIPYRLNVMNQVGDSDFTYAESIDESNHIYSTACCDHEITYLSPRGEGKSFYIPTLPANTTMTVTVGFRCNADLLGKAYLTMDNGNQIVDPPHKDSGEYTTYLFKVQRDD